MRNNKRAKLNKILNKWRVIMKTKVTIEGMSCSHCVNHVKGALEELENVRNVDVNLESKTAIFDSTAEIAEDKIKYVIEDVGYEVVKIEAI
jgi:copper chaperone